MKNTLKISAEEIIWRESRNNNNSIDGKFISDVKILEGGEELEITFSNEKPAPSKNNFNYSEEAGN